MEMAFSEMERSRGEHKDRADPLVGAVLVSEGGKIWGHLIGGAACRRSC